MDEACEFYRGHLVFLHTGLTGRQHSLQHMKSQQPSPQVPNQRNSWNQDKFVFSAVFWTHHIQTGVNGCLYLSNIFEQRC